MQAFARPYNFAKKTNPKMKMAVTERIMPMMEQIKPPFAIPVQYASFLAFMAKINPITPGIIPIPNSMAQGMDIIPKIKVANSRLE